MPRASSSALARVDRYQPILGRCGTPDLAGPARKLTDAGVRRGVLQHLERLAGRVEADHRVRPEVGEPDGAVLSDVDGLGLGAAARQLPRAPGTRGWVVEAKLPHIPLADPEPALRV